jgi:hypothetical protein
MPPIKDQALAKLLPGVMLPSNLNPYLRFQYIMDRDLMLLNRHGSSSINIPSNFPSPQDGPTLAAHLCRWDVLGGVPEARPDDSEYRPLPMYSDCPEKPSKAPQELVTEAIRCHP